MIRYEIKNNIFLVLPKKIELRKLKKKNIILFGFICVCLNSLNEKLNIYVLIPSY